jgi:hydrogenase/urease accessory protein HupE
MGDVAPTIRRLAAAALALACLTLFAGAAFAHGVPDSEAQRLADGSLFDYLRSGAVHMITGYDHLLFLFGVMFFLTRFWDIVKFVTAFTIGHSITLLGATLYGIHANYYLIDAVIAISVIYKGFDNVDGFRKGLGIEPPNLLFMVFGFGLVHGFGLSTRLQNLPLPENGLVERIVAFNVGVELGQIAALIAMVAVLAVLRRLALFTPLAKAANWALMAAGALLFLYQMHGWLHTTQPDDFGFSHDGHYHAHEAMDEDLARQREGRDTLLPAEEFN